MPKIIYTPEGADALSWDFDPDKLLSPECMTIERMTGQTYAEWLDALGRGSMGAVHALLYVLMKRDRPTLAADQVQFSLSEVDVEADKPAPKARKKATPPSA